MNIIKKIFTSKRIKVTRRQEYRDNLWWTYLREHDVSDPNFDKDFDEFETKELAKYDKNN
jgi:hypothetical protein